MPAHKIHERSGGMACEGCGSYQMKVTDSRPAKFMDCEVVRRSRKCLACGHKSFSLEIPESKTDGLKENIKRDVTERLRMMILLMLEGE